MTDGDAADAERRRPAEADEGTAPWRRWGPYLSERQGGTVREDYGADGDAWSYFTHDQARSRASRQHPYRFEAHGETYCAGLGASHQTGWTGLVAATTTLFHTLTAEQWQRGGRESLRPERDGDREEPLS